MSDTTVEPMSRWSHKWKVECEGHKPMLDYVFADNLEEATAKAYATLDIPADAVITVYRVNDVTNMKWRIA